MKQRPRGVTVEVVEHDGPPIDLEAWADAYVARVLELERITPTRATVGNPPNSPKERAS